MSRKRTVTPNDQLLGQSLRDLGEQSQSDLADRLGIDPTNLVALLNDLEGDALIAAPAVSPDCTGAALTVDCADDPDPWE